MHCSECARLQAEIAEMRVQLAKRLSVEDRWNAKHPPNYKSQPKQPKKNRGKAHRKFGGGLGGTLRAR
jgi:hypothetical protein